MNKIKIQNARSALALVMFVLFIHAGVSGSTPGAFAQDNEPNHPCSAAQNLGAVALPFTLNGSLDSTAESPDLDFFRFTGTPGTVVTVNLEGEDTGRGTLGDPLLGLFDSACNLIDLNDDSDSLNSRLVFSIPANRVFILAATSFPDFDFLGVGVGTYRMTVTRLRAIGSISGRIVDGVNGDFLPGDTEPFTFVQLLRCQGADCFEVNAQTADGEGRFQFSLDGLGLPLEIGTYQVLAFANQYQQGQSSPFQVAEQQDRNIGQVRLQPFPVQFSNTVPCDNLPSAGGRCQYTVRVSNRMTTRLDGEAWSLVSGSGIGSFADFTNFQLKYLQPLRLKSQESTDIAFEFYVPSRVRDGASICTNVYIGQRAAHGQRLQAFFDTLGQANLFCVSKETTGFSMMPQKKAQKLFRQLNGRTLTPRKK